MEQTVNDKLMSYIFSNMEDAVCITTKNGAIRHMNNSAAKLFGFEASVVWGGRGGGGDRKIWDVIPFTERNDELIQLFIDAVTKHIALRSLVKYETIGGKLLRLHVSVSYMIEDSGIFVIVVRDLTELFRINKAFERYTSPEIAKYVLSDPKGEKQGGQTKDVTILMSDLRGFTALSTKLSPDTLLTILNHYFEVMIEAIEAYRGIVLEFLGDGIFVVFGAPDDDPDHALHAVSCALAMENAMNEVNAWNAENGYPSLEMGIGINSGSAVVGNIGSAEKMKYGCIGETVNLAGRVETFTVGGQVYISERTKARLGSELSYYAEHSFMPKGAKTPMKIYAVDGIGDLRLAHGASAWKPFVRDVSFRRMTGKTVDEEECRGQIVKISEDERYAVLETSVELEALQNVLLDIGGALYAKVMSREGNSFTICFTSKPDCFVEWVR